MYDVSTIKSMFTLKHIYIFKYKDNDYEKLYVYFDDCVIIYLQPIFNTALRELSLL